MTDRASALPLEESSASPAVAGSPTTEYNRRLQAREAQAAGWEARHVRLGYVRLLVAAGLLVAAWFSWYTRQWPRWVPALPVVLFAAVAVYHARVLRERARAQRAAEVYRRGIARIEDRWAGSNSRDVSGEPTGHVYAASLYANDLDIIGRDGLFELLCTARTRMGEETLLRWLLEPADVGEALLRQQAVAELRGRLDFRERMAVAGDDVGVGVRAEALLAWAEAPDVLRQRWLPWLAGVLAAAAVASVVVWFVRGTIVPLFLVLVMEAAVRLPLKKELAAVLDGTDVALENMQLLAALLEQMEGEDFESERLGGIKAKLASQAVAGASIAGASVRGSAAIARLGTLGELRGSLENPIVRVLNLPLLYSVQLGFAIQRWRRRHGAAVRLWLEAVGEMEALLSLAAYSYEHPGDPFAEFVDGAAAGDSGGSLEGEELGHPLIAAERCVRNSVRIGGQNGEQTRVLLVSGSNMSGKSTLMRTVGVNTVLAMCGAPVRARSLRLTPMRIGASLLVNDSLQSGQSRFYAEIEKLSRICRLAEYGARGEFGVLFLLDELLQGTNSKDRLVGAEGVIGELVRAGAIGIATTHDLSLTEMAGLEGGALRNMHFQDEIVDGQMRFDFRLREGVVTRSNGVELMRLIGLKV